jgi:uncharacterized protein (DUF924 family)
MNTEDQVKIDAILHFWFGSEEERNKKEVIEERVKSLWFTKDKEVDKTISSEFKKDCEIAANYEYDHWCESPKGRLALVLLLDQFPRNIYRATASAFDLDWKAQELVNIAIEEGVDKKLSFIERVFFYLPLEHSEIEEDQHLCVKKFEELLADVSKELKSNFENFLEYAKRHRDIIVEFGRFPHRNEVFDRESTKEELEMLKDPKNSF